jgi:hypothetical protein
VAGILSVGGASGRLALVAIVVAVAAAAAIAVGCSECPRPINPVALRWLSRDCNVGERGRAEAELRLEGARAESTLIWAFQRGPSAELLDEVGAEATSEYDEVAEALNAGRSYGLSAAEITSIRSVTRAENVRSAREEFDRGYRAAALAGLGVLALPRGVALLRSLAADSNSADRMIAVRALQAASQPAQP